MDPPPLPPLPLSNPTPTPTTNSTTIHLSYPDSVECSPQSHTADPFNELLPPIPGAKLRVMCSYGGHIIPRPHDKSLRYIGGETRMVVVDRHSSFSSLSTRLSHTLLNGRPFTLKYLLPHEDLDSLVSVTTDEDLENMIEEYDRITASSSALAPRIRLFIFCNRPETAASMGPLLDDAKSETWFVNALNGSGLIPRNLSDSATMDCLVNLDNDHDLETQTEGVEVGVRENKQAKNELLHDVHTTQSDSPMVENNSSFGSSASSPSMANLPPIRVHVEDQKVGVEEQFAQMSFAQVVWKQYDGYGTLSAALPPLPTAVATVGTIASINPAGGSSEHLNRVLSDDERSDQGMPVGFRKPPLPLQPVQHKASNCYNLPSPDSVGSDTSIASASSLSKPVYYVDQAQVAPSDNKVPAIPDAKGDDISITSSQIQIQQVQDSVYTLPPQLDQQQQQLQQQQFVHASTHFIPHPATNPVPMPSCYPIYAPPSQQQPHHHPIDPRYRVYAMPGTQTQPYISMQSNMVDTTSVVASSHPVLPPTATMVTVSAAYKDSHPPTPIYPTKIAASSANPEMAAANVYRTAVTSTPPLVQIPGTKFQHQHACCSHMQHPSQSNVAFTPAATANYGYHEYANATHDQLYYSQLHAAPLPPQYQTMTPATAVALAEATNQLPTNNNIQQIGSSQPL